MCVPLPEPIAGFLVDTVTHMMGFAEPDPRAALDRLPASMPAGRVLRLAEGGPFGWLLDARLDRVDGRVSLEVCEDSRMSGPRHYRVWDDGSVEQLPTEQLSIVYPPDCTDDDRDRLRREYFAHNRAVHGLLVERGFR